MGRYSKLLPKNLAQNYEEARQDPELLHLKSEAALLDTRICDLLRRVDAGESSALWRELQKTSVELEAARNRGSKAEMAHAFSKLGQLISKGAADSEVWAEIEHLISTKRRVVETIHRREAGLDQSLTIEQVMVLSAMVTEMFRVSVLNHLSPDDDRAVGILTQTSQEIQRLMPLPEATGQP